MDNVDRPATYKSRQVSAISQLSGKHMSQPQTAAADIFYLDIWDSTDTATA